MIPRINILTALYQEALNNFYKFFSVTGFRLKLFPIYFNRKVAIDDKFIHSVRTSFGLFKKNSIIMIDRDSSLSLILKYREDIGLKKNQPIP